jgi:hypothetical protein
MELRFTGASNEQINQLMMDYRNENKQLDELIHGETFIRFYQEIAQLNDIQLPDQSFLREIHGNNNNYNEKDEEERDMNDVTAIYLTEEEQEQEEGLSSDILLPPPSASSSSTTTLSSPRATSILLSDDNDDDDDMLLDDADAENDDVIHIRRLSSNILSDTDEMQLASTDPLSDDHARTILLTDDQMEEMQTDH